MTAKEYLIEHLSDPQPQLGSNETQLALCAYAAQMYDGTDGYNITDAKEIIRKYYNDEEFVESCTDFICNVNNILELRNKLPKFLEK